MRSHADRSRDMGHARYSASARPFHPDLWKPRVPIDDAPADRAALRRAGTWYATAIASLLALIAVVWGTPRSVAAPIAAAAVAVLLLLGFAARADRRGRQGA
jgi:hypothetical protein